MNRFDLLNSIRSEGRRSDTEISNHEALGVSKDARGIRIAWMYPDILQMHGGRGDVMALLHFSNLMNLPCTIRKVNTLADSIPFDWADMLIFPPGDLSAMEDIVKALHPYKADFQRYADAGKIILVNGSSGAIFAEGTRRQDGTKFPGLGLLRMQLKGRVKVYGNDLWITLPDGTELLGPQIQMADVLLRPEQQPLGKVVYGRGNNEKGDEGARTKNVIFTHVLGPLLVKNPRFTEKLLLQMAVSAGLLPDGTEPADLPDSSEQTAGIRTLSDSDIRLEQESLDDLKEFIHKKETGVITW